MTTKKIKLDDCGDELALHVSKVYSEDLKLQAEGCEALRRFLGPGYHGEIERVVDTGVIPRFTELLSQSTDIRILEEVAWCLCNVASGSSQSTMAVYHSGAIQPLRRLLYEEKSKSIVGSALRALSNISHESKQVCEDVVSDDLLIPFVLNMMKTSRKSGMLMDTAMQFMWEIIASKPVQLTRELRIEYGLAAVEFISWSPRFNTGYRRHTYDTSIPAKLGERNLMDSILDGALGIIRNVTTLEPVVEAIIQRELLPLIMQCVSIDVSKIAGSAIRILGNLVSQSDDVTDVVIQKGGLQALIVGLGYSDSAIVKSACWALSNILAGTPSQIIASLQAGTLKQFSQLLLSSVQPVNVQIEAMYAFNYAAEFIYRNSLHKPEVYHHYIVDEQVIEALNKTLSQTQVAKRVAELGLNSVEIIARFNSELVNSNMLKSLFRDTTTENFVKVRNIYDTILDLDDADRAIGEVPPFDYNIWYGRYIEELGY
ncbi:ARM repeat-containing protein [Ramicandelaber brevisporus]|nr:ARM repeat-containing protein [Ramicandelaber brevisporus]